MRVTLELWASNRWLEKLEPDSSEIGRLLAIADARFEDYGKAVKAELSSDVQLELAYDAIRAWRRLLCEPADIELRPVAGMNTTEPLRHSSFRSTLIES